MFANDTLWLCVSCCPQRLGLLKDAESMGQVTAFSLIAPAPDSGTGVTFAGAAVDAQGRWKVETAEHIHDSRVNVPRMSAVVLRSGR